MAGRIRPHGHAKGSFMADVITRFVRSVELIQASAKVLRSDSELLILPVLSGIATLVVGAALVWQAFLSDLFPSMADGEPVGPLSTGFVVWLFAFYFVQYFVIIFFNTALVGAAIARLDGGDPTVSDSLALAWSRIGSILGYALISATVGVLLRLIAEKLGFIGRLIEFGAGLAWTVATFLVVPVLAAEGVGPLKAIERSGSLLSETWGENLIGSGGISLVISFVGAAIILLGYGGGTLLVNQGDVAAGISLMVIGAVAMIGLIIVGTALSAVYSGAVYYFALTGDAPAGFDRALIRGAFGPKE
jgi:hypothetical protein